MAAFESFSIGSRVKYIRNFVRVYFFVARYFYCGSRYAKYSFGRGPRGIKSPCCPGWRLPPLTTHPGVDFSFLRDPQNVSLFLIMYDARKIVRGTMGMIAIATNSFKTQKRWFLKTRLVSKKKATLKFPYSLSDSYKSTPVRVLLKLSKI